MELLDLIKEIASLSGYIITIVTFITVLCKPARKWFLDKITIHSQSNEILGAIQGLKEEISDIKKSVSEYAERQTVLTEAIKCSLRNDITSIYYKYSKEGEIPALEKENFALLCGAYRALKGNSYVEQCYEEIMDLPVK